MARCLQEWASGRRSPKIHETPIADQDRDPVKSTHGKTVARGARAGRATSLPGVFGVRFLRGIYGEDMPFFEYTLITQDTPIPLWMSSQTEEVRSILSEGRAVLATRVGSEVLVQRCSVEDADPAWITRALSTAYQAGQYDAAMTHFAETAKAKLLPAELKALNEGY